MKKQIKTYCHTCDSDTFQTPLYLKKETGTNGYYDDSTQYMMLQCGGCRSLSFLIRTQNPNAITGDDDQFFDKHYSGNYDSADEEFNFLREKDYDVLPSSIKNIYDEVEATLHAEAAITAGIGLRTLVEAICIQQGMKGNTLQEKIKQLHTTGLISFNELPILDKLRLIGNQSTHEIKAFPLEKLFYALEIVNHVLISIFVLPKINKKLKI